MEYTDDNEEINSNNINLTNCNRCNIQNGEMICQECPTNNIYYPNFNKYNHQISSRLNYNKKYPLLQENNNDNENNENNKINQDISSKRFNIKNNISNLESTFSQTFKTFRYEPLSYCPSQDSILNNNLNQISITDKSNKSLNLNLYKNNNLKNNEKGLTYYNYDKDDNNDDYNKIFKNENKKEEKVKVSPVVNNYIEQIRKIYEKEQDNIRLEQYQLQKQLAQSKEENERKINYLNTTLNNIKSQNENDIQNLIKENEFELKKVLDKKDNEINYLSNRNFELEKANNDLVEKINQISTVINKNNINNKDKIEYYKLEINNISKNNNELKNYYEKKIEYLTRLFAEEKNKLIASYESHIDKINTGFIKSKNEYIKHTQNKDNILRNIINDFDTDTNKLNKEIYNLNEEIMKLKKEEHELIEKNIEIKKYNDIIKENYETAKKEIRYQIKQKEQIEQNYNPTQKQFYKLKAENDKLKRLIYGNFKRSKSKLH